MKIAGLFSLRCVATHREAAHRMAIQSGEWRCVGNLIYS